MLKLSVVAFIFFCSMRAEARIKNSQVVLGGLLTRAGVANQQPLSTAELTELCEAGYTQAYFLYRGAGERSLQCSRGTINYRSVNDFRSPETMNIILSSVNSGLSTGEKTFVHCNNGAHASGYAAAIAIRSFCGVGAIEAVKYWDRTLSGYPLEEPNRSSLMNRIRNYPVRGELEVGEAQKSRLGCPNY